MKAFLQFLCGLRGHSSTLHFENRSYPLPPRVSMRCDSCGHNTPGLEPTARGPVLKFAGKDAA